MFYYLYEIKNNINGKIYVGVHKAKSLDDGYMGSGKVIADAIKKYGIEHFTKTILEQFATSEEMYAREQEVVDEEFLLREDVYNLRRGGLGGFDYMNSNPDIKKKRTESIRNNLAIGEKNSVYGKVWITNGTDSTMIFPEDAIPDGWKLGRAISESQKTRVASFRTGTVRITNGVQNKYAKQSDPIPEGWRLGWKKN